MTTEHDITSTTYEIGTIDGSPYFLTIEFIAGRLSISGTSARSCGQTTAEFARITQFAPGWTADLRDRVLDIWRRYHLNDMRAGCEHQQAWPTDARIDKVTYSIEWDDRRAIERQAEKNAAALGGDVRRSDFVRYSHAADMLRVLADAKIEPHNWTALDAKTLARIEKVFAIVPENEIHDYRTRAARILREIETGQSWSVTNAERQKLRAPVLRRVTTEYAGHVPFKDHPAGLLGKPCDVCGYAYGSRWLRADVPADVIETLRALPTGDTSNPYDIIAARLLKDFGITFDAKHAKTKDSKWGAPRKQHWIVTLTAGGRTLTFDFWASQRGTEKRETLRPYIVLASLSMDSAASESPDDVAAELGCKPSDAIALAAFGIRVREFFGAINALDRLQEIS